MFLQVIAITGWAADILFSLALLATGSFRGDRWLSGLTVAVTFEAAVFDPLKMNYILEHGKIPGFLSPLHCIELVTLGFVYVFFFVLRKTPTTRKTAT